MIVKKDEQIKPNINTRKQIIKIIVKLMNFRMERE